MNKIRNTKLCWNCEGEVHIHAFQCPFCGSKISQEEEEKTQADPMHFNPPYQASSQFEHNSPLPQAPYAHSYAPQNWAISDEEWLHDPTKPKEELAKESSSGNEEQERRFLILSILLLSLGSMAFIFTILLALFSEQGSLILQWNSNYWPAYLIVAIGSLYYGWRTLSLQRDR